MMKRLEYYPDTDTLYVEIRTGRTVGGRDAGQDLVIHYGEDGRPSGYEIEHATQHPEHVLEALRLVREANQQAA